jgi:hypothetical protein
MLTVYLWQSISEIPTLLDAVDEADTGYDLQSLETYHLRQLRRVYCEFSCGYEPFGA